MSNTNFPNDASSEVDVREPDDGTKMTMKTCPEPHQDDEKQQPPWQQQQQQTQPSLPPIALVSTCEEMNPTRRCTFEDCAVYAPAGTWNVPDTNMALLYICDGHGGRQMVEYLEDGLQYHVAAELNDDGDDDDPHAERRMDDSGNNSDTGASNDILRRLERAFFMADIHSKTLGISTSGATVAACLITRSKVIPENMNNDSVDIGNLGDAWTIYAANAGDARIVLGHDGKAFRMTKDHRTDDPDEVRRIEQSGGFLFKGRVLGVLAVTRSLGDHW